MFSKENALRKLIGEKIFYFTFGLRMAVSLITSSLLYDKYNNILNPLLNTCNALVLVLLILTIAIFQLYNIKEIVIISILSIIFQIASLNSGQGFIILSWLFICAAKNINLKIVAKETIFVSIFIMIILTGLTAIGVIEVSTMSRDDGVLRYSIGYSNPNQFGYIVLQIIVALIIKKNNIGSFRNLCILFIGFLFSYSVLNCRSVSICICLLGIFIVLFKGQHNSQLKYVGITAAILAPLLSIYISVIYNPQNNWFYNLDKVLSWRITLANMYLEKYRFSLMGNSLDLTVLGALDNAYVRAAIFYGLIPLGIYIYGVVQLFINNNDSRKAELLCIIIMIVYGLMESMIFIINCNFTLLIFANILYKKHNVCWKKLLKSKKILGENNEAFL